MVNFIICELNPLHNGHARLLQYANGLGDSEGTVCIMSSHVTQRGSFSVLDKWTRAAMALSCGADLVLELSAPFAMASAPRFAKGAVATAAATGLKGRLCFGTEGESLAALHRLAAVDQNQLDEIIQSLLSKGQSYPAAVAGAYRKLCPDDHTVLLQPNNLLALEYLKATKTLQAPLTACALPRVGAAHDQIGHHHRYPSASAVRDSISCGKTIRRMIPRAAYPHYAVAQKNGAIIDTARADIVCMSKLRQLPQSEWAKSIDMESGLANRFVQAAAQSVTLTQLLETVKTKRYTMARLRRCAMAAYLQLHKVDVQTPLYLRVLGCNDTGRDLLRRMKDTATLPILTKSADRNVLSPSAGALLSLEGNITDEFMFCLRTPQPCGREFTTSPLYFPSK